MSYAYAAALQAAVYARLSGDGALSALVGTAVYDAVPAGPLPSIYVVLGPEKARDASDGSGAGAWHRFVVSVVTDAAGFQSAKAAAAAVSAALENAPLSLSAGRLVSMNFRRAVARREGAGAIRRVDLTFAARVAAD